MPQSKKYGGWRKAARCALRQAGLLLLIGQLACAWNPEFRQGGYAGGNERRLTANTRGERFGEMTPETLERFKAEIRTYWQSPYLWGGNAPSGIDCSGLVGRIYQRAAAVDLPRTTRELYEIGMSVEDQPLHFADLVFFSFDGSRQPDHVGLYVARGYFIHASVKSGVTLSLITEQPYLNRFVGARRLLH